MEKYLKNLSLISHEVRGALSVVKAYIDIIEKGMLGIVNEQQGEKLRLISDRIDEVNQLLFNVVSATRYDAGIFSFEGIPFDLSTVLNEVVADFSTRAERFGVEMKYEEPSGSIEVFGDRMLVYHAIANLCNNAFKYTPRGGAVTFRTEEEEDKIFVILEDNGIGIHPDRQTEIFKDYVQLEDINAPRSGGVGLGLTLTRLVAESAGGAVSVESLPGEGAIFRFGYPKFKSGTPEREPDSTV